MNSEVMYEKTIKEIDGITLTFQALIDYSPIRGMYMYAYDTEEETKQAEQETIDNINSGKWVYFCACVVATKSGIDLARDYLGSCVYNSYDEFINEENGYCADMCNTVLEEAKKKIEELNK